MLAREKINLFSKYCDMFDIPIPDFAKAEDGFEYTSPNLVMMTDNADIPHVFGHYMCDYHTIEPDRVAEVIKDLVNDFIHANPQKWYGE